MRSDSRGLRGWAVLGVVLIYLAVPGTFTLPAYGYEVIGWGDNRSGQATPPAGRDYIAIAAGNWHSLAVTSDGRIAGWGRNDAGQATPPDGNDFIAIAGGYGHSLALKKFVCEFVVGGDINDDCRVDLYDFARMAENWLIDCQANPADPACVAR